MTALLLLATLASADEPETYSRLFGDSPPAAAPASAEQGTLPLLKLAGPLALAGVAMFAAWKLRATPTVASVGKPLRVIARHPLGDRSALVLLEVVDADGERRRLLVGTGTGAPSLVADLGQVPEPGVSAEQPEIVATAPANVTDEILAERQEASFAAHAARNGVLA